MGLKKDKEPHFEIEISDDPGCRKKVPRYMEELCGEGRDTQRDLTEKNDERTACQYAEQDEKTEQRKQEHGNRRTGTPILGSEPLTMLRLLESYIDSPALENEYDETDHPFDAARIPLDDIGVMSLFRGAAPPGITLKDTGGCPVGSPGIPDLGTEFGMRVTKVANPEKFSDLIRIFSLLRGTGAWNGNARELIQSGQASLAHCICSRDDIMVYLTSLGMDRELSFAIMEAVSMAKGLTPEFEEAMAAAGVPKWYIRSCKKIRYLWPKAHSASRVMSEYRIAYCKIHYPLAFYAAYFSIHGDTFPGELVDWDRAVLQTHIDEYERRTASLCIGGRDEIVFQRDIQETKILTTLRVAREMIARGYGFLPIDAALADERKFRIIGGKLMPSLNTRRA